MTDKLTLTVAMTLLFAGATAAVFGGAGPFANIRDLGWVPGFFTLFFFLMTFYTLAERRPRKRILWMVGTVLLFASVILCGFVCLLIG